MLGSCVILHRSTSRAHSRKPLENCCMEANCICVCLWTRLVRLASLEPSVEPTGTGLGPELKAQHTNNARGQ